MLFSNQTTRRHALQQLTAVFTALGSTSLIAATTQPTTNNQHNGNFCSQTLCAQTLCSQTIRLCEIAGQKALASPAIDQNLLESVWHDLQNHNTTTLQNRITHDFEILDTVTIDGWVLSKTEASLFALTALINQTL